MRKFTIAEAKASIERNCKHAPLSVNAAYFQNDSHINCRVYKIREFFELGYITEVQEQKMMNGYIAKLKEKYL